MRVSTLRDSILRLIYGAFLSVVMTSVSPLSAEPAIHVGSSGYCTTCHGAGAVDSLSPGAPGLCGAEAAWIAARLRAYQQTGDSVMTRLGHGLTNEDIDVLSLDAAKLYQQDGPFCRTLRND